MPAVITVSLAKAVLCLAQTCWPVLVGDHTPVGTFPIQRYETDAPGYGGDWLVFTENATTVFAVHRVLEKDARVARLEHPDPSFRRKVTAGCINMRPSDYARLLPFMRDASIVIREE